MKSIGPNQVAGGRAGAAALWRGDECIRARLGEVPREFRWADDDGNDEAGGLTDDGIKPIDMGVVTGTQKLAATVLAAVAWTVVTLASVAILVVKFARRPWSFFSMKPSGAFERPHIPGMESIHVETTRVRLHALRSTDASSTKPLMLFLHGFPENAYSWRHQMVHFREHYTVVALDMRGFGESDAPEHSRSYSMDVLCLDVVAVIKACGFESCILIGHDWGGMVAWNVASNFPTAVDALITVCSPHPRAYNEGACFTPAQALRSSYFLLFATLMLPEMYLSHSRGHEIRRMMLSAPMGVVNKDALTTDDVRFYVDALLRPGRLTSGLNYYRNAMFTSCARARKFVDRTTSARPVQPTLQLYAASDGAFECSMFENCSISSRDGACLVETVKMDGCSHWAQQDCPALVNREIQRFLDLQHSKLIVSA
jgi:pimeloyl-ACP methyl ester carboxylesterase